MPIACNGDAFTVMKDCDKLPLQRVSEMTIFLSPPMSVITPCVHKLNIVSSTLLMTFHVCVPC